MAQPHRIWIILAVVLGAMVLLGIGAFFALAWYLGGGPGRLAAARTIASRGVEAEVPVDWGAFSFKMPEGWISRGHSNVPVHVGESLCSWADLGRYAYAGGTEKPAEMVVCVSQHRGNAPESTEYEREHPGDHPQPVARTVCRIDTR